MFSPGKEINMLILEMRTREAYAKQKFKNRYNFKQSDSHGNNGYITVDGKVYKVDLNDKYRTRYNDKNVQINYSTTEPEYDTTSAISTSKPIYNDDKTDTAIGIGPDFFKLKGSKRRDAILQHEIGHSKLNHTSRPQVDRERITDRHRRNVVDHIDDNIIPKTNTNKHLNFQEIEADRYAANHVGSKYVKRALRNTYSLKNKKGGANTLLYKSREEVSKVNGRQQPDLNLSKSEKKKANKAKIDALHSYNKGVASEMRYRGKALKDNTIRNAKYLK